MHKRWVGLLGALLLITSGGLALYSPSPAAAAFPAPYTGRLAVVYKTPTGSTIDEFDRGSYSHPALVINVGAGPNDDLSSAVWSPDGTKLAYMFNQNAYIVNANGTNPTQISHIFIDPTIMWSVNEPNYHPPTSVTWSPDGKQLAFSTQNTIYTINTDGSGLKTLGGSNDRPAWSVNNEIYFAIPDFSGWNRPTAVIMSPDGTNSQEFLANYWWMAKTMPDWSPDGKQLAVISSDPTLDGGEQQVYLANSDGSNFHAFTHEFQGENRFNPAWTPDGNTITYESRQGLYPFRDTIYSQNVATGAVTQLMWADSGSAFLAPSWQPLFSAPKPPAPPVPPKPADTKAPTITLTTPGNNSTVKKTINIAAIAHDNVGVTKVEFYVDGGLVGSDTTSPYSVTWNTLTQANGVHTVYAKAYDAAGNTAVSLTKSIHVKN